MPLRPYNTELQFILTRLSLCLIIYTVGAHISPSSSIPTLLFVIGMASSLYKTRSFSWLLEKFIKVDMGSDRQDLINAIVSLQRYEVSTLAWNDRKSKMFKKLSYADQDQAKAIGYTQHIHKVDDAIRDNGVIANSIAKQAIKAHDVSPIELRSGLFLNNSKSIESISHFARDWSELGDVELRPLLQYIKSNIDLQLPDAKQRARTLVVVPGSGLGRVAHELAILEPSFKSVKSVEFSSLMYLCNQFVYKETPEANSETFNIYPFLHSYSHHVTVENHLRSTTFNRSLTKPKNLEINYADFRTFEIEDERSSYDNVLVVTAFFIDTAQNLFDYFKGIERLIGDKKGLWINIGPLKYGTAPLVEFSLEELRQLRKLRGWEDLDEPKPYGSEISGYLTDTKGLWQGYYGLGRWTSRFTKK